MNRDAVGPRSPFAGNPAHSELLPPREGKITSAGDKEVGGVSSAIVPEPGVELCQVNRQIERPSLLRARSPVGTSTCAICCLITRGA
ncbi:hypothetical protein EVAR_75857_1 [Eumeta japonica]|uniref:Uncharacterized protein n=1 Tax=Eumeta variegata TaxID=151549 RepID=A0A4C1TE04_EUMVA|nr:hypothetical protein EVAR_75857_1 [Eumeta japonica]